ncbi:MAG: circadian clock protein KaiB [Flavobacterium sp.]|nr:MAG: circadian clock protein KaiB [Flavobacterium sp.]
MSPKSTHAVENINKICNSYLADNYELEIVDISHQPQLAVEYQIIGIPTLVRLAPNPIRMILGDLSDTNKVLKILDISI